MSAALAARIETAWSALSPQEQRVATFLRERPDESALYNSTELARVTGVSKATVSRLYRRLGFTASSEVRDLLRQQRSAGLPVAVGGGDDPVEAQLRRDVANLQRALGGLDRRLLADAAAALAAAHRVLVVGHRSGQPVAMQLRQSLAQVRDDVRLAPGQGQSLGEELAGLGPGDVVVVVALRRRAAALQPLLDVLTQAPARVLLIADPAAPPAAVAWRLVAPIEAASPFDSYAAVASLVSVLAGAVLAALGAAGAARVREVDGLYARLGELERA